jgi:hypothetical protein
VRGYSVTIGRDGHLRHCGRQKVEASLHPLTFILSRREREETGDLGKTEVDSKEFTFWSSRCVLKGRRRAALVTA